jgi:hypothetical protein
MARTNGAKRKARTHFEQIPLDVVKKIAKGVSTEENAATDIVVGEPASGKMRSQGVPARSLHRKRR